jgi:predicted  nucleic acid-binding Zn-ribbon protein
MGVALMVIAGSLAMAATGAPVPLHERIDALIESEFAGPLTPPASEADFVRRAYLDLVGMIPPAEEARAFFADAAADKRARLVDRLLATPQHARHLAIHFDLTLMERRPQKHVDASAWQQFLFQSCLTNKPWHLLVREILAADGAEEATRMAARFNLDREADPNLLTRDTGRIFFGMNLACAQCHDHPNVPDYLQRDYHGLFAFFNRTYLFTRDRDKKAFVAEKAEGDVTFASVFTKESGATRPRLPGGAQLTEPNFPRFAEYLVPPDTKDKNLRPVPKYNRRAELAKAATESNNRAFNRNIVNRLWAMLMGRPLVAPMDELHSQNPAAYPALLDLLAAEFAAGGYDTRAFLRELALTRAYGRSFELPAGMGSPRGLAATWVPVLEAKHRQLTHEVAAGELVVKQIQQRIAALSKAMQPLGDELAKTNAALADVRKACDPAILAHRTAELELAKKRDALKAVQEAQARLDDALAKLAGDKELTASLDKLKTRVTELNKEIEAAAKEVTAKDIAAKPMREKLAPAEATATAVRERWAAEEAKLLALDAELIAATTRWQDAKTTAKHVERQLETARAIADCDRLTREVEQVKAALAKHPVTPARDASSAALAQSAMLEKKLAADTKALVEATDKLSAVLEKSFAVGAFAALTPEQLAWSMMRATGVVGAHELAGAAEFDKQLPPTDANKAEPKRLAERAKAAEQYTWDKLKGGAAGFAPLFGAGAGEPQDAFFATADQALFLNNGSMVRSWLVPSAENLTARLGKLADARALAEELYLNVLTRLPTEAETAAVQKQLLAREKDKPAVVQELAWGLLTSAEFRFKH